MAARQLTGSQQGYCIPHKPVIQSRYQRTIKEQQARRMAEYNVIYARNKPSQCFHIVTRGRGLCNVVISKTAQYGKTLYRNERLCRNCELLQERITRDLRTRTQYGEANEP